MYTDIMSVYFCIKSLVSPGHLVCIFKYMHWQILLIISHLVSIDNLSIYEYCRNTHIRTTTHDVPH